MQYENRQPEEGVNVTRHNPVATLLKLLAAALVLIVAVVLVVNLLGGRLARHLPFHYETLLMDRIPYDFSTGDVLEENSTGGLSGHQQAMQNYLIDLAARVGEHLPLSPDMDIALHYNPDIVFNAYATLAGNVVFYRGLLEEMPHENALAMVMAHEMAHVMHRDPIAGLGGGLASMLAVSAMTGGMFNSTLGGVLKQTGVLTQMKFTRDMETDADTAAIAAVAALYGHVNGAATLFEILADDAAAADQDNEDASDSDASDAARPERGATQWLETFTRTHPTDRSRIDAIREAATAAGWATTGELTPLPEDFELWLQPAAE